MKFHRIVFTVAAVASLSLGAWAQGRVVILGFDGMDPALTQVMIDAGELPNLKRLGGEGMYAPLATTSPPQSPTAWSSFITCRTPLNHGIYDFLRRDPARNIPAVGFGATKRPQLADDGSLESPPSYVNNRTGASFWSVASDAGKRVKALVVPFAYPADDLAEECFQLCGLDVPDLRWTQSTYFAMSEGFDAEANVAGGMRLPLKFEGDTAVVAVPGIAKPDRSYAAVPVTVKVDRAARTVTLEVQGATATLEEGTWSEWMEWDFAVSAQYSVRAISRFHLMEAGETVRLYMTCLNQHPKEPAITISEPPSYSADLVERYGLFKTVGWAYDTKALDQGDMSDAMFLDDLARTMAWRERLVLDEIDRGGFDLLIGAWTATDRAAHMYWAHRDPEHPAHTVEGAAKFGRVVEDTYIRADAIVGNVMERLKEDDLLIVMSDHGFHSFRYGFGVNTWLVENGYLSLKGGRSSATDPYMQSFDWRRSQAYGLGLGMIFLNIRGRERFGIVNPADAAALREEIKGKLLAVRDEERDAPVFRNIYTYDGREGLATADAPDLQLGYDEGYQTEKASAAGAVPAKLFTPNLEHWSGDHAASDAEFTPGIFFASRKLGESPRIEDIGVTALEALGVAKPSEFEGKSLILGEK